MFEFLKKKLKKSLEGIKKVLGGEEKEEVEGEVEERKEVEIEKEKEAEEVEKGKEEEKEEEKEETKEKEKEEKEIKEEKKAKKEEVVKEEKGVQKEEKKGGILGKIFKKKEEKKKKGLFEKIISEADFEKIMQPLEITLLEANVAFDVVNLIEEKLKEELVGKSVKRKKVEETIVNTIKETFREIMQEFPEEKIIEKIEENKKENKPTVFLFIGVNGVGKTTNMAKFARWLQKKGYSVVFAASDTFRAASIEQLEVHGKNLGIKVIKHQYGADAAAVAYDAIQYAKAHNIDCVLIDSAGRQHTNANLMDELAKIKRVAKPDFTVFVADSMTGNDAVEQAREFGEKIGFDFSILSKADVDQKGGAILSVSYVSGKPIAFIGVGQEYDDLEPFDKEKVIEKLGV